VQTRIAGARIVHYVGDFDSFVGETVTSIFETGDAKYPMSGILRKPNFHGVDIAYFLQEKDSPTELLVPIDDKATLYRGLSQRQEDMIGVVILE